MSTATCDTHLMPESKKQAWMIQLGMWDASRFGFIRCMFRGLLFCRIRRGYTVLTRFVWR